jgi:hypothetical protein
VRCPLLIQMIMRLIVTAVVAALLGCASTPQLEGCAVNSKYSAFDVARVLSQVTDKVLPKDTAKFGLIFGSIGSLADYEGASRWRLVVSKIGENPWGMWGGNAHFSHFTSLTRRDFPLATDPQPSTGAGAAVFCARVAPGDYDVHALVLQGIGPSRIPARLHNADDGGTVLVRHRFTVEPGQAVYLGQFVVGNGGAGQAPAVFAFLNDELDRDLKVAARLDPALPATQVANAVPSLLRSSPPTFLELRR